MGDPSRVGELVAGARAGDQKAWDALVEEFLPLVTRVIGRMRLSAADADDVNQTVWLRLVEHLSDVREPQALPGWLATVARNEALRVIKARGRVLVYEPERPVLDVGVDEDLATDLVRDEMSRALLAALDELPEARRRLLLALLEDPPLSYREISDRLGIPIGYIGPTRARALDQLRQSRSLRPFCLDAETVLEGGGRRAAVG
jgi:RNA polymerase sigma factor (sigma-70 family)